MVSSNHVPWAIITACLVVSAILLLVLRFMLASENTRRDVEQRDKKYDEVYVTQVADGITVEKKVDRVRVWFQSTFISLTCLIGLP
jgi:MFS transporter, ACS family, allantoate permease